MYSVCHSTTEISNKHKYYIVSQDYVLSMKRLTESEPSKIAQFSFWHITPKSRVVKHFQRAQNGFEIHLSIYENSKNN